MILIKIEFKIKTICSKINIIFSSAENYSKIIFVLGILTSGIVDYEHTDETRVDDVHWQPAIFLMYYSIFLAGELRKSEEVMEAEGLDDPGAKKATIVNEELERAQKMLGVLYEQGQLDGLNMYLYSILLKKILLKF